MEIITGPRQSGKTTEAIKLANEKDAYLAVHTKERAANVYHGGNYPNLDRYPITYRSLQEKGWSDIQVVIDDLDMFLQSQLDVPIVGSTMTVSETTVLADNVSEANER